jgi:chitin-binding protein
MESPRARNWYCGLITKPDHIATNTAEYPICAEAFEVLPMSGYNFMSVMTRSWGRADSTPLPTHVCSFDSHSWGGVQTPWDFPMDWPTNPMSPGVQPIVWNASWGLHADDTRDFSYWITKPGFVFSTTRELTWDDFETAPFCMELYDDLNPTANPNIIVDKPNNKFTTKCNVPARTGRHVIYGEWGRKLSTRQRFHGCIDAVFGSTSIGESGIRTGLARPRKPSSPEAQVDALGRTPVPAAGSVVLPTGKK